MNDHETSRAATIRTLNDRFRQTLDGGTVLFTAGIMELGPELQARILGAIQAFDTFETRSKRKVPPHPTTMCQNHTGLLLPRPQ